MGYRALEKMREINLRRYGISKTVRIPEQPVTKRKYGREALAFLRDCSRSSASRRARSTSWWSWTGAWPCFMRCAA